MYTNELHKSSNYAQDIIPQIQAKPTSDNNHRADESSFSSMASGVRDFSSVSILPRGINSIQTKLKINAPGDKYEQEADRIADGVVQSSSAAVQRKCNKCEEEGQHLQTKSKGGNSKAVSPKFANEVQGAAGGGFGLDAGTKNFMESRIGGDFGKVRIHNDSRAAGLNQQINARAFTLNNNIYFNKGEYAPNDVKGKRLLAHELVHTVQQGGGGNFIQKADGDDKKADKKKIKHKIKVEATRETDLKKDKSKGKVSTTQTAEKEVGDKASVKATNKTTSEDQAVTAEGKVKDKKSGISLGAGVKGTKSVDPTVPDKASAFVKISGKWNLLDSTYLQLSTEPSFKLSTDKGPQLTLDNKAIFFPNGILTPEVAAGFLVDKKGFTGNIGATLRYNITKYMSAEAGVQFKLNPGNTFEAIGAAGFVFKIPGS